MMKKMLRVEGLKTLAWIVMTIILCAGISVPFLLIVGGRGPLFALFLNWMVLTWLAVAGQRISFPLPSGYYLPWPFERTGRIYEYLGTRLFRNLLRRGPLSYLNPELRMHQFRVRSSMDQLEQHMCEAEASHMYGFLLMLVFAGVAASAGWFDSMGWMLGFNIIMNGYPIMLQRYNRARLHRIRHEPVA